MKRLILKKNIAVIIAMASVIFLLFSCKKVDLNNNKRTPIGLLTIDQIKANVSKQMAREGGIPQIFTRNQKVTTQWVDKFRNPVTLQQMKNNNNFTSICNYDYPSFANLVQYSRVYRCASAIGNAGYFLQFEYEVSWNNNIVTNDGNSNLTSGYVEIVDGMSNVVETYTLDETSSDVSIVDLGPDSNPYFPDNHIFRVRFVSTDFDPLLVDIAYINSGSYAIKLSATFVTDCVTGGSPYSLWMLPVTTYGFTGASGNDPCDRNDKTWVQPPGQLSNVLYASGYNSGISSVCGFGGGFIAPHLQQVQYNVDGGTWFDMDNYIATSLPIFGTPFIRAADASYATIPSGDHVVGVRTRNWKYILTNPSGWPTPDPNDDCFSPGDNPGNNTSSTVYSTYAYSYWYCTNIP